MRILEINKFFYRRGGAEVVFFDTIAGLRARGHEVAEFSTENPKNLSSDYSGYFVSQLPEFSTTKNFSDSLKIFQRLFFSKEVENKLGALLSHAEPEVAHIHNAYHHLSASTFKTLKKAGIPIVLTVHDVQPMCPNHRMVRGIDDKICGACFQHKYFNCARYRCVNDSFGPSAAATLESYYYWLKGVWQWVDVFLCPSQFMLDKLVTWGFPKEKMRLLRNPYQSPKDYQTPGDKIVYFGRLHVEKGIKVFMQALPLLRQYEAVVAGTGPEEEWVKNFAQQYSLTNVKRLGWVEGAEREKLLREAKVVVVPSLFYENCSLTILESMAAGKIVVAADRGGNRELILNGKTGFLVPPENPEALAEILKKVMALGEEELGQIAKSARELVIQNHEPKKYFEKLEEIFGEV